MTERIKEQDVVRDRLGFHKGVGVVTTLPENVKAKDVSYFVTVDWDDGSVGELNASHWLDKIDIERREP